MQSISKSVAPKRGRRFVKRDGIIAAAHTAVESLERRRLLTSIAADFVDGAGAVLPDQYPGTSGLGWSSGWTTSASNASFSPSPYIDSSSPLNDGGDHLSVGFVIPNGNSNGTVIAARGYSTTGNVAINAIHEVRFDYRVDGSLSTFVDSNDKISIFGDTAVRTSLATTSTWAIEALGINAGSVPAQTWAFQSGVSRVSTGVPLVSGTVYSFTLLLDPTSKTYVATVSDGQAGTGHTYTSGTLNFRSNSQSSSFVHFGMSGSPTGESNTFSIDSLHITPPPPSPLASVTAAAPVPSRVELNWSDSINGETGFQVQRSIDQVTWEPAGTTLANAATFTDVALDASTQYYYRVAAFNEGGPSGWVTAQVTTPAAPPAARGATDPISITIVNPQQYNIVNGVVEVPRGQSLHVNAIANEVVEGDLMRSEIAWDFGDYSDAATKTQNTGAEYNVLPGFNAGHVYDTASPPGTTYTVTLTIKDKNGQSWTAQQPVRVVANTRDASNRVIYVGQSSNPDQSGTDPNRPVSWDRAQQLFISPTFGKNTRVLFRRGDTIRAATDADLTIKKTWNVGSGTTVDNLLFGDYGDANLDRPVILLPSSAQDFTAVFDLKRNVTKDASGNEIAVTNSSNVRIENLILRAEEVGNVDGYAIQPLGRNIVLRNLTFENMRRALNATTDNNDADQTTLNNGLLVLKCDTGFTNTEPIRDPKAVREYFYYAKGNEIALLGNTMGDSTTLHNTRMLFMRGSLLYDNDIYNPKATSGGDLNTLRFNKGEYVWWGNNRIRGGGMTVGLYDGADPKWQMRDVVIDRNRQLVTWTTSSGTFTDSLRGSDERLTIGDNASLIVIRNNYLESDDEAVIKVRYDASDVFMVNNTGFTGGGSNHKGIFLQTDPGVARIIVRNNLYIAPNVTANNNGTGYAINSANADLHEFSDIGGNFWNVTTTPRTSSIFNAGTSSFGMATWNTKSMVHGDFPDAAGTFSGTVELDAVYKPTSSVVEVAAQFQNSGVFTDINGALRPSSGAWTAGAVERNPIVTSEYTGVEIGETGGSTTPAPPGGYDVIAKGSDIFNTADEFHFAYKLLSNDFDVKVRVASMQMVTSGVTMNAAAKAGLMARASVAGGSLHVMAAMTPSGFKFLYRVSTNDSTTVKTFSPPTAVTFPNVNVWVRLRRVGSTFAAYYSMNGGDAGGGDWTEFGRVTLTGMPVTNALVGMAATSHNATEAMKVQFRDLSEAAGNFGALTIRRLTDADTFTVGTSGSDVTTTVSVPGDGSPSLPYPVTSFNSLLIDADGGNDVLNINVPSTISIRFKGGAGSDTMNVTGGTYSFASDALNDTSSLALNVSGGSVSFADSQHLRALTISGGTVTMPTGGSKVLVTGALTLSGSGKLDLKDQDLILNYSGTSPLGTWTGTSYTDVTFWIASGRNGGDWTGSGIVTSMSDANPTNHLTTLGVAEASRVFNLTGTETTLWNGETINATTVVIKYTYGGDVNLDGKIDGNDYTIMDAATASMHSYAEGDLDYNGSTATYDDWFIIDSNIGRQGAPL